MKKKYTTTTAPIKWQQAKAVLKCLQLDENFNGALMLAAGFYFGLRIGDILNLKWNQVTSSKFDLQEQKTGKRRKITVHPEVKAIVEKYLQHLPEAPDPESYVFTPQRRNSTKPISVTAANKRIKKYFENCGIDAQNPSSHTLRKTFGRRIYENNSNREDALILLSQIFNHRDISTTRRYIGLTEKRISNAYLTL